MAEIKFDWDSRELPFKRGDKRVEKALARALRLAGNQALRVAQDATVRYVQGKKLVAEATVRKGTPLTSPPSSAPISALEWTEKVSGKGMPLSKFPFIATRLGTMVHVNATSSFKLLPHTFVRRLRTGHLGIFQRKGEDRLPIKELWTTRISDAMSDPGAVDGVHQAAAERLQSAFARGLERELAKLRRKGAV